MTTTVTVTTHDWPVSVTSVSAHSYSDNCRVGHSNSRSTEFVPANSERSFSVTDTTSVTVRELPKDATGLGDLRDGGIAGGIANSAQSQIG